MARHILRKSANAIPYELIRSARKRVAIEVFPDRSVRVRAPDDAKFDEIEEAVGKRVRWIERQQRFFLQFEPREPEREYVSGESHRYLGRRYRLKVRADAELEPGVKLRGAFFEIQTGSGCSAEQVQSLLEGWYLERARVVFPEVLAVAMEHARVVFPEVLAVAMEHANFAKLTLPALTIRKMKTRWGSCTTKGRILLNLRLIQAPKRSIDYVIKHELCHLLVPDHSSKYYSLLKRVEPDWQARKQELERLLA